MQACKVYLSSNVGKISPQLFDLYNVIWTINIKKPFITTPKSSTNLRLTIRVNVDTELHQVKLSKKHR